MVDDDHAFFRRSRKIVLTVRATHSMDRLPAVIMYGLPASMPCMDLDAGVVDLHRRAVSCYPMPALFVRSFVACPTTTVPSFPAPQTLSHAFKALSEPPQAATYLAERPWSPSLVGATCSHPTRRNNEGEDRHCGNGSPHRESGANLSLCDRGATHDLPPMTLCGLESSWELCWVWRGDEEAVRS